MVFEHQAEHASQWATITSIASKFGMTAETLRTWVGRAEVDAGARAGLTTGERERLRQLERENRELAPRQRDFEGGLGFFRTGARPATAEMIRFIETHRERFGVEPMGTLL